MTLKKFKSKLSKPYRYWNAHTFLKCITLYLILSTLIYFYHWYYSQFLILQYKCLKSILEFNWTIDNQNFWIKHNQSANTHILPIQKMKRENIQKHSQWTFQSNSIDIFCCWQISKKFNFAKTVTSLGLS